MAESALQKTEAMNGAPATPATPQSRNTAHGRSPK